MPKTGGKRKKTRTHKKIEEGEYDKVPKTFVLKRGEISKELRDIVHNMREVFYPYTAMNMKEGQNEKIKNLMKLSANFNVSSMQMFSSTEKSNMLKIAKTPTGPTFTFKITKYTNNTDLQELLPRNKKMDSKNLGCPLLICNGFTSKKERESVKTDDDSTMNNLGQSDQDLQNTMFNNLFPPIAISKSDPKKLKRCCQVDYDGATQSMDFRHYYIRQTHTGINNKIKKQVNTSRIPDQSKAMDFADYFTGNVGYASDSDVDQIPNSKIELDQMDNKGDVNKEKVNLRLYEVGPRLNLKLVKIEEGFLGGSVFFHRFKKFNAAEVEAQKKKQKNKLQLKSARKLAQEENVKEKKSTAEDLKAKLKKKDTDWEGYLKENDLLDPEVNLDGENADEENGDNLMDQYKVKVKGKTDDKQLGKRPNIDVSELCGLKDDQNDDQDQDGEEYDEEYDEEDDLENYDEFIDKFNLE